MREICGGRSVYWVLLQHLCDCSATAFTCFRYIATKLGCKADGITLSPVQAQRANELCGPTGLADQCTFQVGDALAQPFEDNSFDLTWSLESGEHMPDKKCDSVSSLPSRKLMIRTSVPATCDRVGLHHEVSAQLTAILHCLNHVYFTPLLLKVHT